MTTQRVSEFAVPRSTLEVEVVLAQGQRHRGLIFLLPRASLHGGQESPIDLLNRPDPVFPIRSDDDGTVLLATKAQTVRVSTNQATEQPEPERLQALKSVRVELLLTDGSTVAGEVTMELPEGRCRLLDFLNDVPHPFFTVLDGATTHYINRDHVVFARPKENA